MKKINNMKKWMFTIFLIIVAILCTITIAGAAKCDPQEHIFINGKCEKCDELDSTEPKSRYTIVLSKERIKKGETFTATIHLNDTISISEDVSNIQGSIYFDHELVEYVTHNLEEGYNDFDHGYHSSKMRIQFSKTDFTSSAFEVLAGDVMTVTFKAKEHITVDYVKTPIRLESKIYCSTGTYITTNAYEYVFAATEPENPFEDVFETDWYYKSVLWGAENKVVAGLTETKFGPAEVCTRAQIVAFLWRAAGRPEPESKDCPFIDVSATEFYYKAMLWAVENNIAKGYADNQFAPNQTCTRAEMATFLWRVDGRKAVQGESPFIDVTNADYFYIPAIWASQNKIVSGYNDGTFAPYNTIARAETVTMLYRYSNISK